MALLVAYRKGYLAAAAVIDEIRSKKTKEFRDLCLEATYLNLREPFNLKDAERIKTLLTQCYHLKSQYDAGTWRDVYAQTALYFLNCGNERDGLNYALMAANKGDSILAFYMDSQYDYEHLFREGTVVLQPNVGKAKTSNVIIHRVCLSDKATLIECTFRNNGSGWMQIDPNTFIKAKGKRYTLTSAMGIAYSPNCTYFETAYESTRFLLLFPPIPPETKKIDLIENKESTWQFKGIRLR